MYFIFCRGAQEKRGHLGVRETSGAWYEWHFNPMMLVSSVSVVTKVESKISNTGDRVLPQKES